MSSRRIAYARFEFSGVKYDDENRNFWVRWPVCYMGEALKNTLCTAVYGVLYIEYEVSEMYLVTLHNYLHSVLQILNKRGNFKVSPVQFSAVQPHLDLQGKITPRINLTEFLFLPLAASQHLLS